jgi:chromosome segregation ATPase
MFTNRFNAMRLRHAMLIEAPAGEGSGSQEPAGAKPESEDAPKDTSKEFSHALSKRAAEIEAKYADYDDLKAKAEKYDKAQDESKSEAEKLREQLEASNKERDQLKADQTRRELTDAIAKETGLDASVVSMLDGSDEKTLKEHAAAIAKLMESNKPTGAARALPERSHRPPEKGASAMDMLRDAYSN